MKKHKNMPEFLENDSFFFSFIPFVFVRQESSFEYIGCDVDDDDDVAPPTMLNFNKMYWHRTNNQQAIML